MLGAVVALSLSACGPKASAPAVAATPSVEEIKATSTKLTAYLDAEFEKELQLSPEALTGLGRKEQYDKLDDRSDAAAQAELEWRRKSVADMKAQFDPAKLDEEAHTSFDTWTQALDTDEKQTKFRRYRYLISELGGVHTRMPQFLITQHRVDAKADMDAYIARVGLIGAAIEQSLVNAKLSAGEGIRMPQMMYDKGLAQAKAVVSGAPFDGGADNALFADGKAKIKALADKKAITVDEAKALTAALSTAMTTKMKPGYDALITWLAADKANTTPEAKGVGSLPGGADYYNAALAIQTTTSMTADEIHQLGLSEVKRINDEEEALKAQIGFKGTLQELFAHMRTGKEFLYPNTYAGRAAYIKQAETYLAGMKARLPEYFGKLPKADLVVRRVEKFREVAGGAQSYQEGTPDGSRPGIFYAHLIDMNQNPMWDLESTAYHEGLPGHHMQISIAQELAGLPQFRTQYGYTAYQEGWALYTEKLAKEMGGFYKDPYSDMGRLNNEMWRAVRLVVDTGIHSKGWTQEQAVKFFMDNSPTPEGAIRSEIRRYTTSPGQATSYKIGMIKIQQLRDEAKKELGEKFSYPKFHDVVLGGGALPLPVLEARVHRWIERDKAAPKG
jgi:uncharacterized protein (DUF885 family)